MDLGSLIERQSMIKCRRQIYLMNRYQVNDSRWESKWSNMDTNKIAITCTQSLIIILFVRAKGVLSLKTEWNKKINK
jgi:hypothetical protein